MSDSNVHNYQLTCVEALPRPDGSFLASTLQLLLTLQVALYLHWGQVSHVLHALVLAEALGAAARGEAWGTLGLLQVHLHALCPLDVWWLQMVGTHMNNTLNILFSIGIIDSIATHL